MAEIWTHPVLGQFKAERFGWVRDLPTPLWPGEFVWDDGLSGEPPNTQPTEVGIKFADGPPKAGPADEAVELLSAFWSIRSDFPRGVREYIWSVLRGDTESSAWWCGMDDEKWTQQTDDRIPQPTSAEDLRNYLWGPGVVVRSFPEETGESFTINPFTGEPLDRPTRARPKRRAFWAIECAFSCPWEKEHHIAVYWRSGTFIGADYGDGQGQPPDDYMPE